MEYYKKQEKVVEILGNLEYKYVFGLGLSDPESRLSGACRGSSSPFIKVHASADRESDYVFLNVYQLQGYKVTLAEVPSKISDVINSLEAMDTDSDEYEDATSELDRYFSLS